jgi:hypothetical protein
MKKRNVDTILGIVLLAVFIAVVMKPMWQKAWIYMSGAVSPHSSSTHRSTNHHNLLLSVGGDRWVSINTQEKATAYHALVIPPPVELRDDGSTSSSNGIYDTETLKWLCLRDTSDSNQAAEAKSLTIAYHAITQGVTIGSDTYRLAKGNLFVVRLDEEWRPHVTQIKAILDKAEFDEVIGLFKRVLPDDEVIKKFW